MDCPLPYLNNNTIRNLQKEDSDVSKAIYYIKGGITPQKKRKNRDVKLYVNQCKVDKTDLLVKQVTFPFPDLTTHFLPVIPRPFAKAVLTAHHILLGHPLPSQHEDVVRKCMYAIDFTQTIKDISKSCIECYSSRSKKFLNK